LPKPTPTQIQAQNIAKAAIIVTHIGKMFGVMKPSMRMICNRSNSWKLHFLLATTYVNTCRRATQKLSDCYYVLLMGHAFLRFLTRRPAHAFVSWSGSLLTLRLSTA
jgi:hypothetical protein